jgi:hypothetical protein
MRAVLPGVDQQRNPYAGVIEAAVGGFNRSLVIKLPSFKWAVSIVAFFGQDAVYARRKSRWEKMTPAQQRSHVAHCVGNNPDRMRDVMPD